MASADSIDGGQQGNRPDSGELGDYVGNPVQRDMQRRAELLWRSLHADPRYAYEGRLVAIDGASPGSIDELLFLVREQRAAVSWYVEQDDEIALTRELAEKGYVVDRWDHHLGDLDAVRAAERARDTPLPGGHALREVEAGTPDPVVAEFAEFAAAHGVMVPSVPVMREKIRPSVVMYVTGPQGRIVAIAGSVLSHHRDSPLADSAWWGMLCTHPDYRGRGLSKVLGAETILAMAARHGAKSFYTGVRRENAASQAVCQRLGVRRTRYSVLMVVDPDVSTGEPLTR